MALEFISKMAFKFWQKLHEILLIYIMYHIYYISYILRYYLLINFIIYTKKVKETSIPSRCKMYCICFKYIDDFN